MDSAGLLLSEISTFFLPLTAKVELSFMQCDRIRVLFLQQKAVLTSEKA